MTGFELRARRTSAGLTQRELARRAKVGYLTIFRHEKGINTTMHPVTREAIVRVLDAAQTGREQEQQAA